MTLLVPERSRPDDDITRVGDELELAFSVQRNPGSYALLIGAGVSLAAGMPSAVDVQTSLLREAASIENADPSDPLEWWTSRTGLAPRYDDLLARLARTPQERQALLRGFFEPDDAERAAGTKLPSGAHQAIARLVAAGRVRIIVTLNFDHLIETALRDAGIAPVVVSTPGEFVGIAPLHAQQAIVIHLHGDYLNPSSMLNTPEELGSYPDATRSLMSRIASEYGLIIAGWSAIWDDALRELLAGSVSRHFTTWWISRNPLRGQAQRLLAVRNGVPLIDSAESALGRLADASDAIDRTRARHPRSASVAVASAKRELQGSVRAIALHDELREEFGRLARDPALNERTFASRDIRRELDARRERFDSLLAVPAALVATTAYWGDAESDRWWSDEIARLALAPTATGVAALTALQNYPATLLHYAAGIATVAGGRLGATKSLLTDLTIQDGRQGYLGAAESLAADRTLLIPRASHVLFDGLAETFAVHLGLGTGGYEDAWELLQYLHALERAYARIDDELLACITPLAVAAWDAHPWGPSYLDVGRSAEELALRHAIAAHDRETIVALPHLRGDGYGAQFYPRVSASLRRDLNNRGAHHPLVLAGFCDGEVDALRAMVSIVDAAIAAAAREAAAGSRTIHDSGWLDA